MKDSAHPPCVRGISAPNEQHQLAQWLRRVADKLDLIYVRRRNPQTGRWENASLAELDTEEAAAWVALWLAEGRMPVAAPGREAEG